MTANSTIASSRQSHRAQRGFLSFLAVAAAVLAATVGSREARAELVACADTKAPIEVAIARWERKRFVSRGWFLVEQGTCRVLIRLQLPERKTYYFFARALRGKRTWPAAAEAVRPICVNPDRDFAHREFSSIGPRCPEGLEQRAFGSRLPSSGKLQLRFGN